MRYDKNTSNNIEKEKIKTTSLTTGGQSMEIEIKMNGNIYLENNNNKIIFKQILIKDITNSYIYIKANNKSIEDQLSIAYWEYPQIDKIFYNYDLIENCLYTLLFEAFLCAYIFHVKDQFMYESLKNSIINKEINIKFKNIYIFYGNLDKLTKSRFFAYLIYYIYLLYSMGKRICFGGYKNSFFIIINYIFSFIFMLLIIFYFILTAVLTGFSIICVFSFYDKIINKDIKDDNISINIYLLLSTFLFNSFLNLGIFFPMIYILIKSIQIFKKVKEIKNDYFILNRIKIENKNEIKSTIRYLGLDSIQHVLYEYIIKGYPRNLYYTLDENYISNDNSEIEYNIVVN